MKLIAICSNCADYDMKKHRCMRGCNKEDDPRSPFYDDCPLPDGDPVRPQWIPVTERLPDVNKTKSGYESITVIATDGKNVRPMKYERACVRAKSVRRWKWIWDRIYDGSPITHWMPLTAPPKEET